MRRKTEEGGKFNKEKHTGMAPPESERKGRGQKDRKRQRNRKANILGRGDCAAGKNKGEKTFE